MTNKQQDDIMNVKEILGICSKNKGERGNLYYICESPLPKEIFLKTLHLDDGLKCPFP